MTHTVCTHAHGNPYLAAPAPCPTPLHPSSQAAQLLATVRIRPPHTARQRRIPRTTVATQHRRTTTDFPVTTTTSEHSQ
jgi:hypothetical protein